MQQFDKRTTKMLFVLPLLLFTMIVYSGGAQEKTTPEERMLGFYEEVGSLLADNQDDPAKTIQLLKTFMEEHLDEYTVLVHDFFTGATEAVKKKFVETYADRISDAFSRYFEIAGSPLEESEELLSLLDKLPQWDIMELNKYFPKQ